MTVVMMDMWKVSIGVELRTVLVTSSGRTALVCVVRVPLPGDSQSTTDHRPGGSRAADRWTFDRAAWEWHRPEWSTVQPVPSPVPASVTATKAAGSPPAAGSPTEGVRAEGLTKSFRAPHSVVRAVRGIDLAIAVGRDRRAARAQRGRQVDDDRHDARPGRRRTRAPSSVFGGTRRRRRSTPASVGAMLQAGALIRDVTVRELVGDVRGALPATDGRRARPSSWPASREIAEPQDAEAVRRRDAAGPFRGGAGQPTRTCWSSTSRRSRWTSRAATSSGRRCGAFTARGRTVIFATHYLEEADDNADRVVLMAHGRIVADGAPTEIKARVGARTIRATLADVPPERAAGAGGSRVRRAPRRRRRP